MLIGCLALERQGSDAVPFDAQIVEGVLRTDFGCPKSIDWIPRLHMLKYDQRHKANIGAYIVFGAQVQYISEMLVNGVSPMMHLIGSMWSLSDVFRFAG